MTKRFLTIFLFIIAASSLFAEDYRFDEYHFTITLSDQWIQIPQDMVVELSKNIADMTQSENPNFRYGFQLASADTWFQPPYILCLSNEEGSIPAEALQNTKHLDELEQELNEADFPYLQTVSTEKPIYDASEKILWIVLKTELPNVGVAWAIDGMKLTDIGFVTAVLYVLDAQRNFYWSEFQEIVSNIQIHEGYEYRESSILQHISTESFVQRIGGALTRGVSYVFIGLVIAIIVGIVRISRKGIKRLRKPVQQDWIRRRDKVWQLTDKNELQNIANSDPSEIVREAAVDRLKDLQGTV